jgi:hypothetical protein
MARSSLSPDEAARRSERRAMIREERVRQAEQRVSDERERVASTSAKTARLRHLREARDEARRQAEAVAGAPNAGARTTPRKKRSASAPIGKTRGRA